MGCMRKTPVSNLARFQVVGNVRPANVARRVVLGRGRRSVQRLRTESDRPRHALAEVDEMQYFPFGFVGPGVANGHRDPVLVEDGDVDVVERKQLLVALVVEFDREGLPLFDREVVDQPDVDLGLGGVRRECDLAVDGAVVLPGLRRDVAGAKAYRHLARGRAAEQQRGVERQVLRP